MIAVLPVRRGSLKPASNIHANMKYIMITSIYGSYRPPSRSALSNFFTWLPFIAERHPGIAHLFGMELGLRLMKTDSEILLATLGQLFAQGVRALSMHDGIMVPTSGEAAARRAMALASMSVVGDLPPLNALESA
jgi:hypothetical protein